MNVDEFLNFESSSKSARKDKSQSIDDDQEPRKRQRVAPAEHMNEEEKLRILKMLESEPEQESFNETQLKKLLNQLEKRVRIFCCW